ncbi:hypothetical protein [Tritonibacter mobilis]|uniref:hypothetical protein n=1 Tax=Tritonibacter mobilis TaxID=379347 RepID=UPI0039A64409
MSKKQNRKSWPLIEHISPKAAALLNEEVEPVEFNVGWLIDSDDQPSNRGSAHSGKHSRQK